MANGHEKGSRLFLRDFLDARGINYEIVHN